MSTTEPFSPVPDDQPAEAPQATPPREALDTPVGRVPHSEGDDLEEELQAREEPPFRTPQP